MNVKQAHLVDQVSSTMYSLAQLKKFAIDRYLDQLLVKHATATLVGLKPANLIYVSLSSFNANQQSHFIINHLNQCVDHTRLKVKIFCNESKSLLIYIYDPIHLFLSLCDIKKAYLLIKKGYKKTSYLNHFYDIVKTKYKTIDQVVLYKRIKGDRVIDGMISDYINQLLVELGDHLRKACKQYSFPHEIGVFLGYAIEDVLGFIKYKGKHALYTGYWKVYDKLPQKKKLFDQIKASESKLSNLFSSGIPLRKLICTPTFYNVV